LNARQIASKSVILVSLLATFFIWWQVYRFWQGDVGVPLIDLFFDKNSQLVSVTWMYHIIYFVLGTCTWVALSALFLFIGSMLSRILEVGVNRLLIEQKKAFEEAKRHNAIESKKNIKEEGRSSGFGPFIAGLFFGWFITK
jgi:hypothetical protein